MSQKLSPVFNEQTLDSSGVLAAGYKIYTYVAGSTTKLTTYTDITGATAQANPIVLNSQGYPDNPVWLTSGLSYKFVLASPTDTDPPSSPIKTIDNVTGVNVATLTISQWVSSGFAATFISESSFYLTGDQTTEFHVGRRLQLSTSGGTVYGTIISSAYASLTTVALLMDAPGVLDSGLTGTVPNLSLLRNDTIATPAYVLSEHKNRFINGDMRIDQRNGGSSQTITAGAALAYTVDRWYGYCTGANVTGQRVAGTAPNQFNYQYTGTASVTKIGHAQRISAMNSQDLAGTTATLSVDIANSLLSTVTWTAWRANSSNAFGSLASPTKTQIGTGTFTVSSTLERYSSQISVTAASTTGIEVEFSVGAQTSGTWTIGRAKLEAGSVSTTFQTSKYEEEFQLCQPYYLATYTYFEQPVTNLQDYSACAYLPVEMFATPTVSSSTNTTATSFPAAVGTVTVVGLRMIYERRRASATAAGAFASTIALVAEIP